MTKKLQKPHFSPFNPHFILLRKIPENYSLVVTYIVKGTYFKIFKFLTSVVLALPCYVSQFLIYCAYKRRANTTEARNIKYRNQLMSQIIYKYISSVSYPKASPSLQAEKPRLQFSEGKSSSASSGMKAAVLLGI